MVSTGRILLALFFKCLILRRRNYIITLMDLIAPLFLFYWLHDFIKGTISNESRAISEPEANILHLSLGGPIAYYPSNNQTDELMLAATDRMQRSIESKKSIQELESWLDNKTEKYFTKTHLLSIHAQSYGIVFKDVNTKEKTLKYEIRPSNGYIKTKDKDDGKYDLEQSPYGPPGELLGIQARLNIAFLKVTGLTVWNSKMTIGPLRKSNEIQHAPFVFIFSLFIVAYIFLVISITRDVIEEKSSGIKEYMRIVGLSPCMIWIQWLIYTLLVHLPVTLGLTITLCLLSPPMVPGNPFVIWLLLFTFTITCTITMFILSCMFNSPNLGTSISVLYWICINYLGYYVLNPSDFGTFIQICICFLPLNNLVWALETITSFHLSGTTWKMSHFFVTGKSGSNISIGASLAISVTEIVFLTLLLLFLDGIRPGKYGVAKPITFMCDWFSWCKNNSENRTSPKAPLPKSFERPPKDAKVGIGIRKLKKRYGIVKKITAVDCVDLDIYEGEIMALLGHNGAGKTTTMSMLTGMTSPTGGIIVFGEKDICKDPSYRDSLGLCPQHNMYFPKLTVMEHMVFFGMLRGMTYAESKNSGRGLLNLLNIMNRSNYKVNSLSGGMQRRLCLAIALIGSPKVLILDEPTSGLDPENRRIIWDIILGLRGQRTILITTHFMEEADVLGDRIAIMDHGNVVCCGTTMFLKRLYGTGYQLHILKESNASKDDILNLVRGYVPTFQIVSVAPTQLSVNLSEEYIKCFPGLFEALETKKDLKIIGISVTCTTMEDVFLNVANKSTKGVEENKTWSDIKINSNQIRRDIPNMHSWALLCQRCRVLLLKCVLFRVTKLTNLLIMIFITCLPVWLLVSSTVVTKVHLDPQPPLPLSLGLYPNSYNILIHDAGSKGLADTVKEIIIKNKGEVDVLSSNTNVDGYLQRLSNSDYQKFLRLMLFINITKDTFSIQYKERYHIAPIIINLMTNAVLKDSSPNNTGRLDVIIYPYVPKGPKCSDYSQLITYIWALIMTYLVASILAIFTSPITEERVSGFKQQQYLTGVSPLLYWFCNFIYDYSLYLLIIILYLAIILVLGGKETISYEWFYVLALVFMLLGISGIFFVYLFTFLIDSATTSYNLFPLFTTLLTFVPLFWMFKIKSFSLYMFITCILCLVCPLFPFMNCVYHLSNIIVTSFLCESCNHRCEESSNPIFSMITEKNNTGSLPYIMFLATTWILYFVTILVIDYKLYRKMISLVSYKKVNHSEAKDADVKAEKIRVKQLKDTNDSEMPLRAEWLGKKYLCGPKAVKNVSFALLPGECFGLLGVNGAGKTTTFKMLIGEIFPDCGDAVIHGTSVIRNVRQYQRQVGYCPQFDTFPEYLTGEQVLMIIAQLKGIPKRSAKKEVYKWFDMMGITEHAKKKGGTYSGGTKRKLSTAMAFIGNQVVVFLDEPTTGVDPEARRKLWTVMKARQAEGQAVLLTSHSMEECEALCNRLTIMRGGEMMCLGTAQYLKNKFSQGYTVLIKLKDPTDDTVKRFKEDFQKKLSSFVIKDEHHTLINYNITDPQQPLSRLFAVLLNMKDTHSVVEDFSISNTTLEQLFMSFVKK